MGRANKLWYWKARKAYYVTINGKKKSLGADKDTAVTEFHKLMLNKNLPKSADDILVSSICKLYLEWVERNRSISTYDWYDIRLKQFITLYPSLTIFDLKPFHIQKLADTKKSATTQRNTIQSLKTCLKWAKSQGYIDSNPIADMPRPQAESREQSVSPEEFATILPFIKNDAFRNLVICSYNIGCRPQEIVTVEKKHLDEKRSRWKFERKEAKGKKFQRFVYLNDTALKISQELATKHPTGKLFRNEDGNPWTKDAVGCQFDRLQVRMAKVAMREKGIAIKGKLTRKQVNKYAKRYCLYVMRHSFATNALNQGIDCLSVATLLGHKDPSMLARVYQHLNHNPERLLEQAQKVNA